MKIYLFERHFPTKDNLDKKVECVKEMSERGELLQTKEFRKDGRFNNNNNNKRKKMNKRTSNKRRRLNNVSFITPPISST